MPVRTSRTRSTTTSSTASRTRSIPSAQGTKAAAHYQLTVRRQARQATVRLRLSDVAPDKIGDPFKGFAKTMDTRKSEADEFYRVVIPSS